MKRAVIVIIGMCLMVVAGLDLLKGQQGKGLVWLHPESNAAEQSIISVGSISLKSEEEIAVFQPFADYLASRLKNMGVVRGRVVVANSMAKMADLIKKGEVDIYIDSPFPITKVGQLSGAKLFLRRWKKGKGEYHSIIFVRKDSAVETLGDLKGRMIAFDDPFSTSGYYLPKAALMKAGLTLAKYPDAAAAAVPSDKVGYFFTFSDKTTMVTVLKKRVAAGAVNSDSFTELAGEGIGELKVLLKSIDVPRHVVAHRVDLNARLVDAIEKVLLQMDKDEEGKAVLQKFEKTRKFDKFAQGGEETFRPIRELARFIERDLGD